MHTTSWKIWFLNTIIDQRILKLPSGTVRSALHRGGSVLTGTDLPENKHLSIQTGLSTFAVASRTLARSMLFAHLLKLPVVVHVFDSLEDPAWKEYKVTKKARIL